MKYVIGIDLGTSSVKTILVDQSGSVRGEVSKPYPLIQPKSGYSEQDPEQWVAQTIIAIRTLVDNSEVDPRDIEGLSFSGQMHGLVLLDQNYQFIRNAILWNDTRTTQQCRTIERALGDQLLKVTRNPALEGFTLPKLLWVREHERKLFDRAHVFVLPKDYLRYRLTGHLAMDYSDAVGTLLLDVVNKRWSTEVLHALQLDQRLCPPLVESYQLCGTLLPEIAEQCGLHDEVNVFTGGADNACGAIGAGILSPGDTLCSIGTSGVILAFEEERETDYSGRLHFFNHGMPDAYYSMGVTLSAGHSLSWFQHTFASEVSFEELLSGIARIPIGSGGLLFTPYLSGERTPYADSVIRGSFIGMDSGHTRDHFVRSVVEGITLSLRESIDILRNEGKSISKIVSIGGGAKNKMWLQIQADVFNAEVVQLETEQGPAMGAAILAAVGSKWYNSIEECAAVFIRQSVIYRPNLEHVALYDHLFQVYRQIYKQTMDINQQLVSFR